MVIEDLLHKIKENRFEDADLQTRLCDELYKVASEKSDLNLMGVALYYKGETIFLVDQNYASKILKRSISYLNEEESPELVAMAYNMLGLAVSNKEDFSFGLNYFLTCLKVCDKYDQKHVKGISSCNIAVLFQMIGSYDDAIEYFQKGLEIFEGDENEMAKYNVASIYANIFVCLYRLNNIDDMGKALDKLKECDEYIKPKFLLNLYDSIYSTVLGENEDIKPKMEEAVRESFEEKDIFEDLDNFHLLCEFLEECKYIDLLDKELNFIDANISDKLLPKMKIDFVKYRMICCREKGDMYGFMEKSLEYVNLYEKVTNNYHESIREALNLRLYIEELKEKEDIYKKDAVTDKLTGLLNRNGLEEESYLLLKEAKGKSATIASFIMDIDYFKQYNDYYGHVMGDECLRNVAKVIFAVCGTKCVTARYGGDEFVIICENVSKEWVEDVAKSLVSKVAELKMESEDSPISDYVSVSVGAYYGKIAYKETLRSLVEKADKGLYKVKENGRNNYTIMSE